MSEASASAAGDMLGFRVRGENLALAASEVLEVVRVPPCTRVPNAPPALIGLANLRGSVLPVVSVSRLLGGPDGPGEDAAEACGPSARVMVMAGPVGLLVDAVSSLSRGAEGRVLAPNALLAEAFGGLLRTTGAHHDPAPPHASPGRAQATAEHEATPLIGFRLAAQEYALALREVTEVVRVPTGLAEVPRTDDAMLGVIAFRGGLLPVVSPHALLGLPDPEHATVAWGPDARIVATHFEGMPIGLLVEQVSGLLSVPAGAIDPVPPVLLRGGEAQLAGICRLQDGRLAGLLSPALLFDPATAARLKTHAGQIQACMQEPQAAETRGAGDAAALFVVFRIGEEAYGLPVATVSQVVRRPESVSAMPRAPGFVVGVMNLRGRAIPVICASRLLGVAGEARGSRIIVVTADGLQAGLAVESVPHILRVAPADLRAAPAVEPGQAGVLDRIAIERDGRMILLLSAEALLAQAGRDLLESWARPDVNDLCLDAGTDAARP